MVSLLSCNYNTWFCHFYADSADELDKLPTHNTEGKDDLKSVKSCAYGSRATCANGKIYVLSGDNEWIAYTGASGGSGSSGDTEADIEPISDDMISKLFD